MDRLIPQVDLEKYNLRFQAIGAEYLYGDIVYIATDPNQDAGMIVQHVLRPGGIVYGVQRDITLSYHFAVELTRTKDYTQN